MSRCHLIRPRVTLRLGACVGLAVVLSHLSGALTQADNWPGFRGASKNGVADVTRAPTVFGPTQGVLWKTEILPGLSSPVVWDDRIFLTAAEGNSLVTICLSRKSGEKLWEKSVPANKLEPIHKANSHATSTPVIDGKSVFVYFGSFGLIAYSVEGEELWQKPLPTPKTFFNQGTGTSPVLVDGKLVVFVQIGQDSHVLAVNPADGKDLWKAPVPIYNNTYATPIVWAEKDRTCIGIACAGRFVAFDLATGKDAWWVDGVGQQACATPIVASDRIVISAAGVQGELSNMTPPPPFEELVRLYDTNKDNLISYEEIPSHLLFTDRQTSDGKGNMSLRSALGMFGNVKRGDKLNKSSYDQIAERLVSFRLSDMNRTVVLAVRTGGNQDVTKSRVVWKETKGVPEVPSPLAWQGRLYLVRSGGILVCRDLETGRLIYEHRIDSPGGYFASPVLAGGALYLASDRGTVTVVKAGDQFEILARNDLNDPILASPAIVEDVFLIRSMKTLWAFGNMHPVH